MPKSRRRKGKNATREAKSLRTKEILEAQREAFRKKFGRDWKAGDPVFFDPDADEPTPMSTVKLQAEVLEAMRESDAPPQFAYAYKKTGLLGLGDMSGWPADHRKEWNDAIDEFFALEAAAQSRAEPHPKGWDTEIPELLASPFSQEDLDQVHECLRAVGPIEARGMKVVTRIELAAAFLVSACDHAFDSADATGAQGEGPNLFAMAEELVIKRARELYAKGPAP